MRIFLWIFGIFAAATGLAVLAKYNVSNIAIFFPPYRIDFSLNFFLLLLILFLFLMYFLMRATDTARRLPARVAEYRRKKREDEGNLALRDAVKSLFEGRFVQAEKSARKAAELPENAGNAALIGARAAQALQQEDRRDEFFREAERDEAYKTARLMTSLELFVDNHQTKEALDVLAELNASGTRHVQAQRWALKANQQAQNWDEVLKLVQSLDKRRAIRPVLANRLRELAYDDLFTTRMYDPEHVGQIWQKMRQEDRVQPYIAVRAARAFAASGMDSQAREILVDALKVNWDDRLVKAYRELAAPEGPELLRQIENCEEWAKQHPMDLELSLSIGALCLKEKLWGKARNNLERVVHNGSDTALLREAHLLLAILCEKLNQTEEAMAHYKASAITGMSY